MNLAALCHRPIEEFVYPQSEKKLVFRLQTARKDFCQVMLLHWPRYGGKQELTPMTCSLRDEFLDFYFASVSSNSTTAYTRYCFQVQAGRETRWYGPQGIWDHRPDREENFFEFLWPNPSDGHRAPAWADSQIYYQIFPERFRNGDLENDPPQAQVWGSPPTRENFMGGDLRGILEKLDYLQELGITCLYLTPVFQGVSNHKYDTVDYFSVDPVFGDSKDLHALVDGCHARDMRILLDGVFNHCGYEFPQFQDFLRNGECSHYRDWFLTESFPITTDPPNYACVGHYKWMPKINLSNPETRDYFISVGSYWVREFQIDGWRLDVADEVATVFWEQFAASVKQESPDLVLIGETWGDAGRLVCGNRLDGAMNYLFKDAVTDWLGRNKITAEQFDHRINHMLSLYPMETNLRMYNLLDSHDTARFLTVCGDVRRLKLAVALMMTFPGCPAVYYGDEIGMEGETDPDCRRTMIWEEVNQNLGLFCWYQKLIGLRKRSQAMQKGDFHSNLCGSGCYGYLRSFRDETIAVAVNPSGEAQGVTIPLPEGGAWCELLSDSIVEAASAVSPDFYNGDIVEYSGAAVMTLPAYSVLILQKKGEN